MFEPKFTITQEILKDMGAVEAAKEVIERAVLVPKFEAEFRQEALVRTVHYGTKLEGNDLSLTQAEKVVAGEMVTARDRDIQEVINYRAVMEYLDRLKKRAQENYSEAQLKKIHRLTTERILAEDEAGEYRQIQVVVRNLATQEVSFRPPPAVEVPYQIQDWLGWLNSGAGRQTHPVLRAGITHYELARIHPFVDGNGRAARAMALLVLFLEGYGVKKFFALEEYYDRNAKNYYQALQSVEQLGGDETVWLQFFVKGLAEELTRVKDKVAQLAALAQVSGTGGAQVALTERQIQILEAIRAHGGEITTREAREVIKMVSTDTIIRDLNDLIDKRVVEKTGSTKASKYSLVQVAQVA
jgi:Fic family protein